MIFSDIMAKKKTNKKSSKKKTTNKSKSKEPTWDEIGKLVGKKIEKASKDGNFSCDSLDFKNKAKCHGTGGCFYFLGFVGALIYNIQTAPGIWEAFIGFLKAIIWPAFLVYGVLNFIGF